MLKGSTRATPAPAQTRQQAASVLLAPIATSMKPDAILLKQPPDFLFMTTLP
jgi:hypothetical protein